MSKPVMDYQNFLWRLLRAFTDVRLSSDPHAIDGNAYSVAYELIVRGLTKGYISSPEFNRLARLLRNAALFSGYLRFPDARNAGPYMPASVWFKRHNAEAGAIVVKLGAQDSANEKPEPVPAPTPRRELRLLCVLAKPQLDTAQGAYLPIHTMHRLPPRAMVKGQWSEPRYAGLHLRETQARQPSESVLARCERHRQTHALRASARTVRAGGVSA